MLSNLLKGTNQGMFCIDLQILRHIQTLSRFKSNELIEVIRKETTGSQSLESTVVLRRNDFQSSTKLDALMQNLRKDDLILSLVLQK
jgi:hypothetical protein